MDQSIYEKIDQLTHRINELARQQTSVSQQLVQLINELEALKQTVAPEPKFEAKTKASTVVEHVIESPKPPPAPRPVRVLKPAPTFNTNFEEFVGKNLASKVGILVTIIGIFIGAKYAIEHDMVSEGMRIAAGYICGLALVGVAIRLKQKYEAYSAVLMGGGLAVLYFITFIAYSAYALFPQIPAFGLMLVCTIATVYTALWYNRVIIAHLGLVGAYAIPFLLSNNSGQYAVLFAYIAIINTGILVVSFKRYWKSLFYAAFVLTWIIYVSWFTFSYREPRHLTMAWMYLTIFFLTFYVTFLSYKLIKKEKYTVSDVAVLLGNAFAFYGIGYGLLDEGGQMSRFSGTFTLINAAIHLIVSQVIRKLQLADKALYYLVLGLVAVFCTIAVPVQFDGNWVTLLWTAEAVLLFVVGRTRAAPTYEKLGIALIVLGFGSLLQDWLLRTVWTGPEPPFLNITFATGLLVAVAEGIIIYVNRTKHTITEQTLVNSFYDYGLPVLMLATCYFAIELELFRYFNFIQWEMRNEHRSPSDLHGFAFIIQLLYTIVFVNIVAAINLQWIRNSLLAAFSLGATALLLFIVLIQGLGILNELATFYQQESDKLYYGSLNIGIRYITLGIIAWSLWSARLIIHKLLPQLVLQRAWLLSVHTVVLAFISAEYLCWTGIGDTGHQYKLGLSIIWGIYALLLIVLGIRHKQKHVRLAAIVLFSITLIKLFLYDLADAGTITKTISFISLGVILLLVSFLYNKYKDVLFGEGKGPAQ